MAVTLRIMKKRIESCPKTNSAVRIHKIMFFRGLGCDSRGGRGRFLLENGGEIIFIFKTQVGGDCFYRFEGISQVLRGQFHFLLQQIIRPRPGRREI